MPPELEAMIAGSRDAVKRVIADLREKADAAEQLRSAEHRAFMAEQREALAALVRHAEDKIAQVRDGADGKDGRDGADGRDGDAGPQGEPGKDGLDGANGRDGVDGKDGEPGAAGKDGENGIDGKAGRDGLDVSAIEATQDGATVELAFTVGEARSIFEIELPQGPAGQDGKDGEQGQPGQDAYHGEARGLFDEAEIYRALDVVSFNGSEWRAKKDGPGPLPGDGWMLSASRGKRGDRGERGESGKDGMQGKDGASVVAAYVDTNKMKMVLTRDDGGEVEADLYDLATKIREA